MDRKRILEQLKKDEGFSAKAYFDNRQFSYGYGCRAPGEGATITKEKAAELLEDHLDAAIEGFKRIFRGHEHKFNEVREECFVQLIFNMGTGRPGGSEGLLSFKNTLGFIFKNREVPWESVAQGLVESLWYRQVGNSGDPDGAGPKPGRGARIVRQIRTGVL